VGYFVAPVIAAHDRRRFEVFCYTHRLSVTRRRGSGNPRTAGATSHRESTRWRPHREDGIDVLDLAGPQG
jgi:predicted O-linked N-acetylglucosamine transferase (SPINDLY family)